MSKNLIGAVAVAIVVWILSVAAASPAAFAPSGEAPACREASPALDASAVRAFWVFLSDRGPGSTDMADLARRITPEAWARRARGGQTALPDEFDRPVWEPYVREVAQYGFLRHRSRWLNAVSIDLSPDALAHVTALPFVTGIRPVAVADRASIGPEYDSFGQPLETTLQSVIGRPPVSVPTASGREDLSLPYGPSGGQLQEIAVPALHALGFSANRVRFMMLDTGFRLDHQAFARAHILAAWDFIFGDSTVQNGPGDSPTQQNHGSGCWSVAGGYSPGNLIGPAYDATFVLAKTEDTRSETRAEEDNYVAALEWADSLGVQITSASLSYGCFDDGFCYEFPQKDGDTAVITRAVDIAAARGILCVNSIGNYGCDFGSLGTPADADSVVSIGAVDSLNQIGWFSACGPSYDWRIKPEVVARGVYTYWADANIPDGYGYANGTSLSAPLVSGAAALLMEAHPEWSAMEVRQALLATADRAHAPDNTYGWGRISAAASLYWRPLVYPMPFSLIDPADSSLVEVYQPTFRWHASTDPDHADPIEYTLFVQQSGQSGQIWSVPAGTDTVLTLPFALFRGETYLWQVAAEDQDGHRRTSRETMTIRVDPGLQSTEDGPSAASLQLDCSPNPFVDVLRFRVTAPATRGAEGAALSAAPSWAVYDPLGRRVASGKASPNGDGFEARWNGRLPAGGRAAPGVYYLEVRAGLRCLRETLVRLAP